MTEINHFFESLDLRSAHWIVSFIGVFLCVFAMQSWSHGIVDVDNKFPIINGMRRVSLWLMALSFLWGLGYVEQHPKWQPWPPDLFAIIVVDIFLSTAIIATFLRRAALRHSARFDAKSQI